MKNSLRHIGCLLVILGIVLHSWQVSAAEDDEDIPVGRIAHIDGKLLRFIEEFKDWVVTVKDSPFALDDALYSEEETKVEIILPNKTWLRIGENTQIQLISLSADTTTIDIAAGLARFYNKSQDDSVIKATTPFGYIIASAGAVFDLYVGDESLEVIAISGNVDFVHEQSGSRYEVWEGASSLIANSVETAQGNGTVDSDWDDWNDERETIWKQRMRISASSANLLPEPIRDQAYALEENGQWERVSYEGTYRDMWRPTRVDHGWRPFTAGRWTLYYGDNCWIPDEPFGYVTHHYGSWVFIETLGRWYWAPPVVRHFADTPRFSISFGWFPGRVGWLHSGPSLGWVPLAPDEDYYAYRPWGRRTIVIKFGSAARIDTIRFRHISEAVIIDRDNFYRGSRYTPHIQRNISRDVIVNNYRPTTVINTTIINNINIDKRRYTYNDIEVHRKPHNTVVNRIEENHSRKRDLGRMDRQGIERALMRVKAKAEPSPKIELQKPSLSTRLVAAEDIAKPLNGIIREKKDFKPKERERSITRGKGKEDVDRSRPSPFKRDEKQEAFNTNNQETTILKRPERRPQTPENGLTEQPKERRQQASTRINEGRQKNRGEEDVLGDSNNAAGQPQIKSPRKSQREEIVRPAADDNRLRRLEDKQGQRREKATQELEKNSRPNQEPQDINQQQQRIEQRRQQQELRQEKLLQQTPATISERGRRQNNRGEAIEDQTERLRGKAPQDLGQLQENRLETKDGRQTQEVQRQRQQKDAQQQQDQEVQQQRQLKEAQRQQAQEVQRQRQQKDAQRQQEQEVQQQQQQKEAQKQQEQEVQQQRQLKEAQKQQEQEVQRQRQQKEAQRQQEQEVQRQRQQKEAQRQQEQEVQQQRKLKEAQRQQEQEVQRQRQQKDAQRQQEQEVQRQRQQKDAQRQQEQEVQRQRQQKDAQRQQEQEVQRQRQQKDAQRQQEQEVQRQRQQKDAQRQQDDSARQKKKKQLEEELLQQQKAQAPGGG